MFLIVGLGNPGAEYANTRHNVGFMVADVLHEQYGFGSYKSKFDGLISEGNIDGEKVYLLKPQTFMNLSGNSVVKAAHFYKILPQNIIVIHDDMDLKITQIKAKLGGGAGGHNGLKSIDAAITPNYNRIRLGIGHPDSSVPHEAVVNHVLAGFSKAEHAVLEHNIALVADTIGIILKEGVAAFSNKIGNLNKLVSK